MCVRACGMCIHVRVRLRVRIHACLCVRAQTHQSGCKPLSFVSHGWGYFIANKNWREKHLYMRAIHVNLAEAK